MKGSARLMAMLDKSFKDAIWLAFREGYRAGVNSRGPIAWNVNMLNECHDRAHVYAEQEMEGN